MTWFEGVPQEVEIAGVRFWLASEALEDEEKRLNVWSELLEERGERPNPDWAATALFLLARVQLDQLVEILVGEFGIQTSAFSGAEVSRRLGEMFDNDDLREGDMAHEIESVGEAVDLWRALRAADGGGFVEHGFAVDGSITMTVGPDLPELDALGLRGSNSGELEMSPIDVLGRASACTQSVAQLAVTRRRLERAAASAPGTSGATQDAEQERKSRLRALEQAARPHFSIWSMGSERAFVEWAVAFLERAGLVAVADDVSQARSAAYLMSLWALFLEFNAYGDEGAEGDWRYEAGAWVGGGIEEEHLRTLNAADQLGWELDDPETEAPLTDVCVSVVERYHRDVAEALQRELGDAFTFAYFWAARYEDTEYPPSAELVDEIVNDGSVMFGDPHSKLPAFNWVQSGMYL